MRRTIRPEMTVRQLAHDCPATRGVFLRYGIPADKPPYGPILPLDRAARLAGVSLSRLLAELSEAAGWPVDQSSPTAHRPFLTAALTIGAFAGGLLGVWMAWLLVAPTTGAAADVGHGLPRLERDLLPATVKETAQPGFGGVPLRHALAHATLQLWGFVVPFIVGIALRWLPMATARRPLASWQRHALLALLLIGTVAVTAWCEGPERLFSLGITGSVALLLAAGWIGLLFVRYAEPFAKPQAWSAALALACAWLVLAAGLAVAAVVRYPAGPGNFSPGLRLLWSELLLAGFVFHCIFGFGLRILPPIVGAPVRARWGLAAVVLLSASTLILVTGRLAGWQATTLLAATGLAGAWGCYLHALPRLRRPRSGSTRPEQGPRPAAWLVAGAFVFLGVGVMLLIVAGIVEVTDDSMSEFARQTYWPQAAPLPLYDAARHALTLGFVTAMIVGVGSRLVPMLEHRVLQWPRLAAPTYVLLVLSVAIRVAADLAVLAWAGAVWGVALSAVLSWAALVLFLAMVLRTFWPGELARLKKGKVDERTPVALLLSEYPETYDVLVAAGAGYLRRVRAVPTELTLGTLLHTEAVDVERTLNEVRRVVLKASPQGSPERC